MHAPGKTKARNRRSSSPAERNEACYRDTSPNHLVVLMGTRLAWTEERFIRLLPAVLAGILTLLDDELMTLVWTSGTKPWKCSGCPFRTVLADIDSHNILPHSLTLRHSSFRILPAAQRRRRLFETVKLFEKRLSTVHGPNKRAGMNEGPDNRKSLIPHVRAIH